MLLNLFTIFLINLESFIKLMKRQFLLYLIAILFLVKLIVLNLNYIFVQQIILFELSLKLDFL